MNLKELGKRIFDNAKNKGFYDNPPVMGTRLMLCVSELSEALEADRKSRYADSKSLDDFEKYIDGENQLAKDLGHWNIAFEQSIKDTFEDEIADTIIRLLDLCEYYNIDIEKHILWKMRYNESRPHMHGGKKY